jgi:hypothetical protein
MFSLRARILTFIFLILLIIAVIAGFMMLRAKQKKSEQGSTTQTLEMIQQQSSPVAVATPSEQNNVQVKKTTSEEAEKNGVQQIAKIFIERYGSYSTDNSYQNIRDVQDLVTKRFWSELSQMIRPNQIAPSFSSRITNVYSTNLIEFTPSSASVGLKAKIIEEKTGVQSSKYAGAKVYVVKEGNDWLVDRFVWEN